MYCGKLTSQQGLHFSFLGRMGTYVLMISDMIASSFKRRGDWITLTHVFHTPEHRVIC
jgi:hypothetical protein